MCAFSNKPIFKQTCKEARRRIQVMVQDHRSLGSSGGGRDVAILNFKISNYNTKQNKIFTLSDILEHNGSCLFLACSLLFTLSRELAVIDSVKPARHVARGQTYVSPTSLHLTLLTIERLTPSFKVQLLLHSRLSSC